MYGKLSADQVQTVYSLFRFLERLRIIGHVVAHTEQSEDACVMSADGNYMFDFTNQYAVIKDSYTPDKSHIKSVELLEEMFGKLATSQLRGTD